MPFSPVHKAGDSDKGRACVAVVCPLQLQDQIIQSLVVYGKSLDTCRVVAYVLA